MEPIFLKPVLQDKIWGGEKLQKEFGLEIPTKTTGEAWCISAHPNGISTVVSPEQYKGMGLDELYKKHSELFGLENKDVFPLLIKILDAKEDLSVQVHPNDTYGLEHEGELGKTECWYVISADEGAKIVYGHNAEDREQFEDMVSNGEWSKLLVEVPVKAGDFFDVPAGTIHAIGGGVVILETQQNSDTTYRVYDYNRKDDNGNERELHIRQSAEVSTYPGKNPILNIKETELTSGKITHYLTNEYFSVYKWETTDKIELNLANKYTLATVIKGEGKLIVNNKEYNLKLADSFILPSNIKNIVIEGNIELITSKSE